jgi:hypothetical protein
MRVSGSAAAEIRFHKFLVPTFGRLSSFLPLQFLIPHHTAWEVYGTPDIFVVLFIFMLLSRLRLPQFADFKSEIIMAEQYPIVLIISFGVSSLRVCPCHIAVVWSGDHEPHQGRGVYHPGFTAFYYSP